MNGRSFRAASDRRLLTVDYHCKEMNVDISVEKTTDDRDLTSRECVDVNSVIHVRR